MSVVRLVGERRIPLGTLDRVLANDSLSNAQYAKLNDQRARIQEKYDEGTRAYAEDKRAWERDRPSFTSTTMHETKKLKAQIISLQADLKKAAPVENEMNTAVGVGETKKLEAQQNEQIDYTGLT